MYIKHFCYGLLGGILLYIPFAASYYTFPLAINAVSLTCYCLLYYMLGGVIVVFSIAHKNRSIKCAALRTFALLIGLALSIQIGAYSGFFFIINKHFNLNLNDVSGNAAAIITALWIFTMVLVSIATNIVVLIRSKWGQGGK